MSMSGTEIVPVVIEGTTSAVTYPVAPPSHKGRLVGMRVGTNTSQTGAAPVSAGLAGATNPVYSLDLDSKATGQMHNADNDASATEAEINQLFTDAAPVELSVDLAVAGQVVVYLEFDAFIIGQGQNSTYA